jgi:membrane peptidoglycan carboxypeptidase
VAERRPSYYLAANRKALDALTDDHLDLLANANLIPRDLAERAKAVELRGPGQRKDPPAPSFVEQKAANLLRIRVAALLGESRLYDLDRLDLQVHTTINQPAQQIVSRQLQSLAKPKAAAAAGLIGHRLLQPGNPLDSVIYSFTLYERRRRQPAAGPGRQPQPAVRHQQPGAAGPGLHRQAAHPDHLSGNHRAAARGIPQPRRRSARAEGAAAARRAGAMGGRNPAGAPGIPLDALLDAAMRRPYSAAPETFFTGGGIHNFANFDVKDNGRVMDVWEATRNSVNLVYIRIMRDIVRHYTSSTPGAAARILEDAENPLRETYLARYVDQDGRIFIHRFYQHHKPLGPEQMADELYARTGHNPMRFTVVFRYLEPRASLETFVAALHKHVPASASLGQKALETLYRTYAPDAYSLTDIGYLAQVHPLELWVVKTLRAAPQTDLATLYESGMGVRLEVYNWLFNTSRKNVQDIRIRSLLEVEAFEGLLRDWKRLGYPFDNLTPSYASAIGSSGDRPAALADLMGILVNDGVRMPMVNLSGLHFAANTPYETRLSLKPAAGERLMPAEVAQTVRRALAQVVDSGTAARLAGALKDPAGKPLVIGGKTGTGDHRYERYGRGGHLLDSRVVNRTATFVFYLGDKHFGTLTALVPGEEAGQFGFTSSLTAQILKTLLPQLQPHLNLRSPAPAGIETPRGPEPAAPAPAPRPPAREKPDGATSQADPLVRQPAPFIEAFPEDVEPDETLSVPLIPPPEPTQP